MTDFSVARENMIESQVRPNGVTDHRIIAAMAGLSREDFVPASRRAVAYMDEDVPLTESGSGRPGRYLMEAMAFARLVQLAEVRPSDKVLHVGAASGYGSAVLAQLGQQTVALESDAGLAAAARANLARFANVSVAEGSLADGCKGSGPYDVIVIEGQVEEVPQALLAQLADGGRLVAVSGETAMGRAKVWTRSGETFAVRPGFDASVAALAGFAKKRPAFAF